MHFSFFSNYTSTAPGGCRAEDVVRMMHDDANLKSITVTYRSTRNRAIKEQAACVSPACLFSGGKREAHITALTGVSMADFDHLTPDDIGRLRSKVNADRHTLLSYVTISGCGLRVLFRYELDTTAGLDLQKRFYRKAFAVGNDYYASLLSAAYDQQCKNVTRLSGLAHDPEAYFNPDAVPFATAEIEQRHSAVESRLKGERRMKRDISRLERLFTLTLAPELEAEGAFYAPGSHNDYVMRLGYRLNAAGIPLDTALSWALPRFADYDGTEQVVRSCYQRTEEFGTRRRKTKPSQGDGGRNTATVSDIADYLRRSVHLRHNTVTMRTEYQPMEEGREPDPEQWRTLDDRTVNSLWKRMSESGLRANCQDVYRIIESDHTPAFHPFRSYLSLLPEWHTGDKDHIAALASTVRVKGGPDKQRLFTLYLRKWLTAMVAAWVSDTVVNHVILVLIGPQGSYKTTWFNHLLPPQLRSYFLTKTNSQRMTKDDLIALTQYALINFEELDTMRPAELNQLKAAVTMPTIDERAAYARYTEHRTHIASFCGTGNNVQFLTDPTGNRRWLPFEIDSIDSPHTHPFDHTGIYSQAYSLLRQGFRYWFERDETDILNSHNRRYETARLEHELVNTYFRKPNEGEHGLFMTTAQILQYVGENITQKLSAEYIGRAMVESGFERRRVKSLRGFIVIRRDSEELKSHLRVMAMNADTDE